jgi:hypothetical protein
MGNWAQAPVGYSCFPRKSCSKSMFRLLAILRVLKAGALLVCLCTLPPACEPPGPTGGDINIIARSLRSTPTTLVRFTLQSPSVLSKPLIIPLVVKSDQDSTIFKNLPVASDYLLTADALGSDNGILAHGAVAAVSITKGKTTQVIIYLNPIIAPTPFVNSSPLIDAITLPTDSVAPGGQITFTGSAHDPDSGQTATLAFSWVPAAACGIIVKARSVPGIDGGHPSQSLASWIAPQKAGNCQITLTVKDVQGLATSASFTVRVAAASNTNPIEIGTGSVTIVVQAPSQSIKPISTMMLNITKSSAPEVDLTIPLVENGIQWSAVISDLPVGTDYTFNLSAVASDGTELYHGIATGQTIEENKTADIVIDMNQSTSTSTGDLYDSAPVIGSLVATATTVSKNDTVVIKISALDRDAGDTAGITWNWTVPSNCGSLSAPANTAGDDSTSSTSSVVFTATAASTSCQINVTVMDARLPLYLQSYGTVTIQISGALP